MFDVIHCARRIFCRFCSGNHVAKDAGICKSTVCDGMEVDAVETVIELIRCSLSIDLEGFPLLCLLYDKFHEYSNWIIS